MELPEDINYEFEDLEEDLEEEINHELQEAIEKMIQMRFRGNSNGGRVRNMGLRTPTTKKNIIDSSSENNKNVKKYNDMKNIIKIDNLKKQENFGERKRIKP